MALNFVKRPLLVFIRMYWWILGSSPFLFRFKMFSLTNLKQTFLNICHNFGKKLNALAFVL